MTQRCLLLRCMGWLRTRKICSLRKSSAHMPQGLNWIRWLELKRNIRCCKNKSWTLLWRKIRSKRAKVQKSRQEGPNWMQHQSRNKTKRVVTQLSHRRLGTVSDFPCSTVKLLSVKLKNERTLDWNPRGRPKLLTCTHQRAYQMKLRVRFSLILESLPTWKNNTTFLLKVLPDWKSKIRVITGVRESRVCLKRD